MDYGVGFEMQDHLPGFLGLESMRERLHAVGGHLTVESAPGAGTRVRARLPVTERG
jgi:signal transduction histidine kinase